MDKKGFTLVELLAVVIILSLLVLITSTSVTKVLKNSNNKLSNAQIGLIESAAKAWGADNLYKIDDTDSCLYLTVRDLKENGLLTNELKDPKNSEDIKDDIKIKITRSQGKLGHEVIDYEINPKSIKGCSYFRYFANGTPVYFDVKKGKGCIEEEYAKSFDETTNDYLNSSTEYNGITESSEKQNSCLKFYAFNDDKSDTIDLLLDHNTTVGVAWNSSGVNTEGPKEIMDQLKEDTKDWEGTITPLPYTVDQRNETSGAYYTIDYEGFNARLITLEDLMKISNSSYSFNKLDNKWLFDRISDNCEDAGCENNSDAVDSGYYTATPSNDNTGTVYSLFRAAFGEISHWGSNGLEHGIRPVIKVYKKDLIDENKKKINTINDICTPVTEDTKTSGYVPKGNYENGDEYICEVRPGAKYRFYVVSRQNIQGELITEDTIDKKVTSVNLIMDRNMCSDGTPTDAEKEDKCYVAWYSDGDDSTNDETNTTGPITAMTYLYNATKSWANVEPLNYEYRDREYQGITTDNIGYISFKSTNGVANITSLSGDVVTIGTPEIPLRARMPIYTDNTTNSSKNEVANFNNSNGYLYENLSNGYWEYDSGQPTNIINKITAYWTLASSNGGSRSASRMYCGGRVNFATVFSDGAGGVGYGARPVINLSI